jgi:hypothetical protein
MPNKTVNTTATTYNADVTDDVINVNATGGAKAVKLPSAFYQFGNTFTVTKTDGSANAVTVTVLGSSNTINGAASYILTKKGQSVVVKADGNSDYTVVSQSGSGKAASTALTSSTTISIDPTLNENFTLTPAHTATINAAGAGVMGQDLYLFILTSGTSSFTLTFGANFLSSGTLATGTADAKYFLLKFRSNGVKWLEQGRTAAL